MLNYLASYKRILAIAENGLFYGHDVFDKERYNELKQIALQLISQISNEPLTKLIDIASTDMGYQTPKMDARAWIIKNDKVLLVKGKDTNQWALLGGYAEIGLSPIENCVKEVYEETGFKARVTGIKGIFDTDKRPDIHQYAQFYKLVFQCKLLDGEFQQNSETSQIAYFDLNHLPVLDVKRTTKEQLHKLMYHAVYLE